MLLNRNCPTCPSTGRTLVRARMDPNPSATAGKAASGFRVRIPSLPRLCPPHVNHGHKLHMAAWTELRGPCNSKRLHHARVHAMTQATVTNTVSPSDRTWSIAPHVSLFRVPALPIHTHARRGLLSWVQGVRRQRVTASELRSLPRRAHWTNEGADPAKVPHHQHQRRVGYHQ